MLAAVALHDDFDSKKAYAYAAEIAEFGERWPGSAGHTKTEAMIHRVLAKDGPNLTILSPSRRAVAFLFTTSSVSSM